MAIKREKIHFETVEELLGAPVSKDETSEIKIEKITPFENHPFKVLDDESMNDLVQSIKDNGVLVPVLVRPNDEGGYEMISGHRRMHAASRAGLTVIPAIIKKMTDDEATIAMVDANMQREELLPSERAFSLKMKMDAMRRQGRRSDLIEDNASTSNPCGWRSESAHVLGEEMGMGGTTIRRYIRLTELVPDLLKLVDEHRLPVKLAEHISFIDKEIQQWMYEYYKENKILLKEQVDAVKAQTNLENFTRYTLFEVMNAAMPEVKDSGKVHFSKRRLDSYFPPSYTTSQREEVIVSLLEQWKKDRRFGHV